MKRRFLVLSMAVSLGVACSAGLGPVDGDLDDAGSSFVIEEEAALPAGPKLTESAPMAAVEDPRPDLPLAYTVPPYKIQTGDVVEIKFLYHPVLNTTQPVRPDGRVSVAFLGDVPAAGLTPTQLRKYLSKKYETRLDRVEIQLTLKSFSAPPKAVERVFVGGEVLLPRMVDKKPDYTVLQALFEVGGYKDSADLEEVRILRGYHIADQTPQMIKVNVANVISGLAPDTPLMDRDVIVVPKSTIAKIGVGVNQYLNNTVPRWIVTSFGFAHQLGTSETRSQIVPP